MFIVTSKLQVVETRRKLFGGQEVGLAIQGWPLQKQEKKDGGDSESERECEAGEERNQNTPQPGSQSTAPS